MVVDLLGITEELSAGGVADSVAHECGGTDEGPLGGAELSVLEVGEEAGAGGEETAETEGNDTELSSIASGTTLSSEELLLGEEVLLGGGNDLISSLVSLGVLGVEVLEVPVVHVSEPVSSHCL